MQASSSTTSQRSWSSRLPLALALAAVLMGLLSQLPGAWRTAFGAGTLPVAQNTLPMISLNPTSGPSGQTGIVVTGTAWDQNASVDLKWDGAQNLATVPAGSINAAGGFTANVTIPSGQKLSVHTIVAQQTPLGGGTLPAAPVSASADFTVTVGPPNRYVVSVTPTTAIVNSKVAVSAQLVDIDGNNVSTSGVTVNWSASNGGSFFDSATGLTAISNRDRKSVV